MGEGFIAADTEDNSKELAAAARPGYEKKITQVAAIGVNGDRFYLAPRVARKVKRRGFTEYQMDLAPFFNWLNTQGEARCYFHNLRYDLGNLFPGALDGFDQTMVGNRLISAKWNCITFLDSFNLWPMALKTVGKAVGIEKLDFDSRSRKYVDNDCLIVRKAVQVAGAIADEFETELPATLGSLAVDVWIAMGGKNWHWPNDFAREAYYGGRVELFAKEGSGEILYTDINSLYPFVMTQPFPVGSSDWLGLDDKARCLAYLTSRRPAWGVASVTLEIPSSPIAPLPVERVDGSIYYPIGRVRGIYTVHEIRNALAHGARLIELEHCAGSLKAEPYYRRFVNQFYLRRKNETDDGRRTFYKLLLNNLYGQLGMSGLITRSLVLNRWLKKDKAGRVILGADGRPELAREGIPYGKKLLAEIQMPLPDHANYLHAAYVTSYARLVLQKFLRMIPAQDLIYCDTDSIFFHAPGFKSPFPIGAELGQMKLVSELVYALCQGPKLYTVKTKQGKQYWKAKGVPNRKAPGAKKTLPQIFMERDCVTFQQPYGMRESIAYFDRQAAAGLDLTSRVLSVWRDVEKRKHAVYDKKIGKIGPDGVLHYLPKRACETD